MMKSLRHLVSFSCQLALLLCATILVTGCSTRIQVTEYPTGEESRLVSLTTYCWADSINQENILGKLEPTSGHHAVFDKNIRETINADLNQKGYQLVSCTAANFKIDYRMGLHEDVAAVDAATDDKPANNAYGPRWSIGDNQSVNYEGLKGPKDNIITVRHGTIHIAAFLNSNVILWHSSAEKTLNDQDSDEARKAHIKDAVQKIMAEFPKKN